MHLTRLTMRPCHQSDMSSISSRTKIKLVRCSHTRVIHSEQNADKERHKAAGLKETKATEDMMCQLVKANNDMKIDNGNEEANKDEPSLPNFELPKSIELLEDPNISIADTGAMAHSAPCKINSRTKTKPKEV